MKRIFCIYMLLGLILPLQYLCAQTAQNKNELSVSGVRAGQGEQTIIPVHLVNSNEIVSLQFKMVVPEGITITPSGVEVTGRKTDHMLTARRQSDGTYLFVLYSPSNKPLQGKEGLLIRVPAEISPTLPEGSVATIQLKDVILSNSAGDNIASSLTAEGTISVISIPRPDIAVDNVSVSGSAYDPSGRISVSYSVRNIGDSIASGGWTEQFSLVNADGESVYVGSTFYGETLLPNTTVSRQVEYVLPKILGKEGPFYAYIKLTPVASMGESISAQQNNSAQGSISLPVSRKLYLELNAPSIQENSISRLRAMVSRSGDYSVAETFTLTNSSPNRLQIPASVVIPAGQSGTVFYITAIDDQIVNRDTLATLSVQGNGYTPVEATLRIEDDELPSLTLTTSKVELNEGDQFFLTIARDMWVDRPLTVSLSTNLPKRITLPGTVTIPAGQTSVEIPVQVVNDEIPAVNEDVTFTASAPNYQSVTEYALLLDDDVPEIQLSLSLDTISEASGLQALVATLTRTSHTGSSITVKLSDDSNGKLYYSSQTLTLNPNVTSAQFSIGVIDNALVDGDHTYTITAAIYIASCSSCSGSGASAGVTSKKLTVVDDDGPSLQLSVSPATLLEGKEPGGTITVTRNTSTEAPLTVILSCDHEKDVTYTHTLTIPAGAVSVSTPITVKANEETEGDRTVVFTATSEGFTKGYGWAMITDQTLPDAVVSGLTLSANEVETKGKVTVSMVVSNQGAAVLPSQTKVNLYLSHSTAVFATFYTQKNLEIGESETLTKTVTLPDLTGSYTFVAKVNEDQTIKELMTINNSSEIVPIQLLPAYSVTAASDRAVYKQGETITIHGTVSGSKAANVPVEVYLICNEVRQVLNATSDAKGNYTVTFEPTLNQSGHFILGACYPDEGLRTEMAAFDIYGLKRASSGYITCETVANETYNGEIILRNACFLLQSGIKAEIISAPENCVITFDPIALMARDTTAVLRYTLLGTAPSPGMDYEKIEVRVTSSEGASLDLTLYYYCRSQKGELKTNIHSINTTVTKGSVRDYQLVLYNTGKGETGEISLSLPSQIPWVTAVTPLNMPSLQSNDSTVVLLRFAPTADVPLNIPVPGTIGINCKNGTAVPLQFIIEPVSETTGTLIVDVCDEYTYETVEAPHLSGAQVTITRPDLHKTVIAQGVTDQNGLFTLKDIPEGYYEISVTADRHESFSGKILVNPARDTKVTVNINIRGIGVSYEVKESTVEDKYEIITKVTYETNVPVPVVEAIYPDELPLKNHVFNIYVINKGLITAQDVTIAIPEVEGVEFTILSENPIRNLAPQQSAVIPVRMRILSDNSGGSDPGSGTGSGTGNPDPGTGGPISNPNLIKACTVVAIKTSWFWWCGPKRSEGVVWRYYLIGDCPELPRIISDPSTPEKTPPVSPVRGGGSGGGHITGFGGGGGVPTIVIDDCYCEIRYLKSLALCVPSVLSCLLPPVFSPILCIPGVLDGCFINNTGSARDRINCGLNIISCIPIIGCPFGLASCLMGFTCLEPATPQFLMIEEVTAHTYYYIHANSMLQEAIYGGGHWSQASPEEKSRINTYIGNHQDGNGTIIITPELYTQKPESVSEEALTTLIERINNTIKKDLGESYDASNIIDLDSINKYKNIIAESIRYAESLNYSSVPEMLQKEWELASKKLDNSSSSSVCASISLQFSQEMTMTRQAFEGTLTVFNGNETTAMQNVKLNLTVKDSLGNEATSREFQINIKDNLNTFAGEPKGEWSLAPNSTGVAIVEFIPTKHAAPTEAKQYQFGGSLSYIDPFTGLKVTRDLYPATMTVKPSPDLELTYFMQRDVLGDDPLTEEVEPKEEAEFALLITNKGYGDATNLHLITRQPEIIVNEKGLKNDFRIVSSALNGEEKTLVMSEDETNFGTIPAHSNAYAQWWFTSDLLGHFTSYDVTVNHLTSYGNENLSLIDTATIKEMIRSIDVPQENGNSLKGFLVNEIADAEDLPDQLYLSDGTVEEVAVTRSMTFIPAGTNKYILTVTPTSEGWNYANAADPTYGSRKLISITRNEGGKAVGQRNLWQTDRTLRDGKDPLYEKRIHFVDAFESTSAQSYLLTFEPVPDVVLAVESYGNIPSEGLAPAVKTAIVCFNKPIDPATFTAEDITLTREGKTVSLQNMQPATTDNRTFTLNLEPYTSAAGYYTLVVQAADITDAEGFKGKTGKPINWMQDGKVALSTNVTPADAGNITPAPGEYDYQKPVTLQAVPTQGYEFTSWNIAGNEVSLEPSYELLLTGEQNITAVFTPKKYPVTISCETEMGAISGGGTGTYSYNDQLNLAASPAEGYDFTGWIVNGEKIETATHLKHTVEGNTTITAEFTASISQSIALSEGWNWMSVRVNDKNLAQPSILLEPIQSSLPTMRGNAGELSYTTAHGWTGTLTEMKTGTLYKLQMQGTANLPLYGKGIADLTQTFTQGWNWMGYLPENAMNVQDALANLTAETGDVVMGRTAFSIYDGTSWKGTLTALHPDQGYLYKTQSTKSFSYPLNATAVDIPEPTGRFISVEGTEPWTCDTRKYPDNMGVIAQIAGLEPDSLAEYTVAAFVNGECRGISQLVDGHLFLTVHGQLPSEEVLFKMVHHTNGFVTEMQDIIHFSPEVLGVFGQPVLLHSSNVIQVTCDENKSVTVTGDVDLMNYTQITEGLDGNKVTSIDLTDVTISPDISIQLLTDGLNPNCLIYTSGNESVITGRNVIHNGAASEVVLTNASDFYCPATFTADKISYTRTPEVWADGTKGWETIVLPFTVVGYNASLSGTIRPITQNQNGHFWLRALIGSDDGILYFQGTEDGQMQSNTPYIIAFPGDAFGINNSLQGESITFRAANCMVPATPDEVSSSSTYYSFNGIYTGATTKGWMLNEVGGSFQKQDAFQLLPFRAYINSDPTISASHPNTLIISGSPTSLNSPDSENGKNDMLLLLSTEEGLIIFAETPEEITIYDVMGVAISHLKLNAGKNVISDLPDGVYFINQQKVVVQ